jgi:hypothetical protein
MGNSKRRIALLIVSIIMMVVAAPASFAKSKGSKSFNLDSLFPATIDPPGEKVIIVNPNVHAWGAYMPDGQLIRTGMATAGNDWCRDIHRSCRTKSGSFRIYSLGDRGCRSHKFPVGRGGAPMPYCMFFNGGQALHGSYEVVRANVSHGCVRLKVNDAEWLRFEFVEGPSSSNGYQGTRVIVKPY